MLKGIKIRIYPSELQQDYLAKLFGWYRFIYNNCLNLKSTKFNEEQVNLGLSDLGKHLYQDLRKDEKYTWLNEHNTKVLTQSILDLLEAYTNFFKNGNGFPHFKSKFDKQSCRFTSEVISSKNDYESGKLTLNKQLKDLEFITSDKYTKYLNKHKDKIRSATLSKTKSGKYFLSFLVDGDLDKQLPEPKNDIIGIDLGIKDFVITSNGDKYKNLKPIRSNEKKLVKLNRQLSKKEKGSKNRNKARLKLARFHETLNNKKNNYLHHITNELLSENQTIVMENLNVEGMLKNHNLARSLQELSLGEFKRILKYKAEWYGRNVIEIDRFFPSSKLCNKCGYKYNNLSLNERSWVCPDCGEVHDRDLNASINIREEGRRIKSLIGIRCPE